MKKLLVTLAACVAASAIASPATAARVLCTDGPVLNLVTTPCIAPAPGNAHGKAAVEAAIFEATGSNISLTLYGKSDDNPGLFNFSVGNPDGDPATNWSILAGLNVQYVTVKAANELKVYQFAGAGASSGFVSTEFMLNRGGQRPDISHISFWTAAVAAVPEPGTWAMMILGFGVVGGAMRSARQRRKAPAFA